MVLVETLRGGAFRVIGTDKEMVRLGARTLSRGKLPASAMARGLETLRKYKRLAESAGAEKILAVATSAIREATNGEDFLERIGTELEIWPRTVAGDEEARLIPRRPAQRAPRRPPRPRRGHRRAWSWPSAAARGWSTGVSKLGAAHDRGVREERSALRQGRVAPINT
jgi:hypothetical protein